MQYDFAFPVGIKSRTLNFFLQAARQLSQRYGLHSVLFSPYYFPFAGCNAKVIVSHRINNERHWLIRLTRVWSGTRQSLFRSIVKS